MAKKPEVQVNEAAFLKSLNKKKAAAKVAAKSERPAGMLDDAAIMQRLGLEATTDRITINARVSKIQFGYAKKDTDRPYFRFAYSLSENSPLSDKGKGLIVSNYHELTEGTKTDGTVFRTEEEAWEQLFYEFQGLGDITKDWADPTADALGAAKEHTKNKTEVSLSFSVYERSNGDLGMNIRVSSDVAPTDDSDLEDDEETDSEGDDGKDTASDEEGDYNVWVGGWVAWTDDEGTVEFLVEEYNEDEDTFSGKDEDDEEYTGAPVDQCEWCENQRDD